VIIDLRRNLDEVKSAHAAYKQEVQGVIGPLLQQVVSRRGLMARVASVESQVVDLTDQNNLLKMQNRNLASQVAEVRSEHALSAVTHAERVARKEMYTKTRASIVGSKA